MHSSSIPSLYFSNTKMLATWFKTNCNALGRVESKSNGFVYLLLEAHRHIVVGDE